MTPIISWKNIVDFQGFMFAFIYLFIYYCSSAKFHPNYSFGMQKVYYLR